MKTANYLRIIAGLVIASTVIWSCASEQPRTTDNQQPADNQGKPTNRAFDMGGANAALGAVVYSPGNRGFEYQSVAVSAQDFQTWATRFKPQIEQALAAMGTGFVLQVTGHTCSIGPRDAVPAEGKKGNIFYSTERAKGVFNALVQQGILASRMTFKGIADTEVMSGIPTTDQRNRRVTFKIVPAPAN